MSRPNRSYPLILVIVVLLAVLILLALRLENHISTVERQMMDRAPSARPLRTLAAAPEQVATSQTVYVPVYSHIYVGGGREQALEVTLSIRNTDPEGSIVVKSIRYYDDEGRLLREYVEAPVLLEPLASTDFLVERRDLAGGVGANFLIDWVAESAVSEPVIETVMVGTAGNQAFAFARPGHPTVTITGQN